MKRCFVRLYLQLFVVGLMSYLHYLCVFAYSGVQHIVSCYFVLFVYVYHMLPISLDCLFLIATLVLSNVYAMKHLKTNMYSYLFKRGAIYHDVDTD